VCQVLQETGDIWQVESLRQRLKKTDEYFEYIILKSEACAPVGIVWKTKMMKDNWILYGNNLSLDIMKPELIMSYAGFIWAQSASTKNCGWSMCVRPWSWKNQWIFMLQ
jgi:hypothetical protein